VGDDAGTARGKTLGGIPDWAAASLTTARVLIVDDQDANVRLLKAMLKSAGVTQIEGVTDPRIAIERVLAFGPDILLLDLHMPTMDGVAVLAALRDALPADAFLPVIVLTADATSGARERALAAGAKDFLTKPIDRLEVLLRVSNLLETRNLYQRVQRDRSQLQGELEEQRLHEKALIEQRRDRLARVDSAMATDGLRMVFQPIVELESARIVGYEALARFSGTPHRSPDQWFEEADIVGRGTELELLAVERAIASFDALPSDALVSLNVSPGVARTAALAAFLARLPGSRTVLELTEHTRIRDYGPLRVCLDRFRERGVRIAVDDAGAGYAGLQHILSLQPDVIKLDLALIRNVDTDPARRALCACLMRFAVEIGAEVVAEGIETPAEFETVRGLGIRWGQGFYLGRPVAFPQTETQTVVVA
jgi:EAL domain-containing protein (putative c-di-GMP-specific phosphodiesterase class I)/DNA-binding NarL/FixJ family response regulator